MKAFDLLSNAVRAKEIFTVLARHGFTDLLNQIDLPAGLRRPFVSDSTIHRSKWERIRLALEELGPAWVKFGQLLSMRPDVIPHPLILELRKLQDAVPPVPFAQIRQVLIEELDDVSPDEVFIEFAQIPAAAASLAQVYFARLRSSGRKVAVKVQRPNIERTIHADLELATWLAGQLHHRIKGLKPFDLPSVVEAVGDGVEKELDFRHEARNQQYFNTLNPEPEKVFAPEVISEYTTARLLVMELIEGRPADIAPLEPEAARELAGLGARSIMHQVLVTGFFHADPHAGNVLITHDGRLCFLDWGLAGLLTRRLRHALADFWIAALDGDAERVVRIAVELAPPGARVDRRAMERDVTLALIEDLNFSIGRQEIGRAMLKLLFIFGENGIPLASEYSLMAKSVLAIEEVGRALDPNFDLRKHAGPVMRQAFRDRSGPKATLRRTRDFVGSALGGLQELPGGISRLIRRFEQDDITINFNHRGLDDALKIAANRITLGVVSGSLVIGSSLIVTTGIRPYLFGYPALGIVGYLLSAMIGFYVMWDIVRRGGHR